MFVTQSGSRSQFRSLIRSPKTRLLQAVVVLGVICWTSLMTRNVIRIVSGATTIPQNMHRTKATSRESIDPYPGVDLEFSDHHLTPSEVCFDTHGLILQSTLISTTRRMAVINGEQVNEGTTTTIEGIPVQVDSVNPQCVTVTVDGMSIRLPLVFGTRQAFAGKTTSVRIDSVRIDDVSSSSSTQPSTEAPAVFR